MSVLGWFLLFKFFTLLWLLFSFFFVLLVIFHCVPDLWTLPWFWMFLYFPEYSWGLPAVTLSGLKTGWSSWVFLLISVRWDHSSIWSEDNYGPFLSQDLSDIQTNIYELLYFSICVVGPGTVSSLTRVLISVVILGSSFSSLRHLTHCADQHSAKHSEMCPFWVLSLCSSLLWSSGLTTVCFSLPPSA